MHRSFVLLLLLAGLGLGLFYLAGGGGRFGTSDPPGRTELGSPKGSDGGENLPALTDSPTLSEAGEFDPPAGTLAPGSARRVVAQSEETPVLLHVKTVAGRSADVEGPLANVPFVITRDSEDAVQEVLLRGQTDALGQLTLELEQGGPLLEDLRKRVPVSAQADTGFQWQSKPVVESTDEPLSYNVEIVAIPGLTIRGEVLDKDGKRTLAAVWVRFPESNRTVRTYSASGGFFYLHLNEGGVGDLIADAGYKGVGSIRNFGVTVSAPAPHQVIQLGGNGQLQGRVTNAAGQPVTDLPLLVQLESLEDGSGDPAGELQKRSQYLQEGRGRPRAELTTNKQGHFNGAALYEGAYTVRARLPGTHGAYPFLLTSRALSATGAEVELRFTRPHLMVRLLDADGQPWSGGEVKTASGVSSGGQEGRNWPTHTQLIVVPSVVKNGRTQASGEFLRGREVGRGEFMFELTQGPEYLVGATGPGFDGQLQLIQASPNSDRQELELTATPGLALGRIRINTTFPDSAARKARAQSRPGGGSLQTFAQPEPSADPAQSFLDKWMTRGMVTLQLIQPDTRLPILNVTARQSERSHLIQAPAGSYLLVAGLVGRESRLDSEQTGMSVRIVAGQEREIDLQMVAFSVLEVTLSGSVAPLDSTNTEPKPATEAPVSQGTEGTDPFATLDLVSQTGIRVPLLRKAGTAGWWPNRAGGVEAVKPWPLGQTNHSIGLPPGTYDLVGRLTTGQEVRTAVRLNPGQVTRVSLEF